MTTPVGERDALLQATTPRYSVAGSAVLLNQSAIGFHIAVGGANDPASITFTAAFIGLAGPATFAATGCTITTSGNVATLAYAGMPGSTASVTASVIVNGVTFTSNTCFVTKVLDGTAGTNGTNGTRGPGQYYASGTAWSDVTANAAVVAPKQVNDVVTITGTGFAQTKKWDGTNWVLLTGTVDPALLLAASLDATKFASSIEPVTMVTSVPVAKSTSNVFNTTDSKLYRWNGTAYVTGTAASDVSGTLADAQIAALAASKITGTLTNAQIAALDAAKLTGQITGTQITNSAISTPKIATGAVTANEIAAGAITTAKLSVGTGRNLVRCSTFPINMNGWVQDSNTTGGGLNFERFADVNYTFGETAAIYTAATPANGTVSNFKQSELIPVVVGNWYEASAYINTHRCNANVAIVWLTITQGFISVNNGSSVVNTSVLGNQLGYYTRSFINAQAPANAAFALIFITSFYTGMANPYTFFLRCYFGESNPNQTTPTPWSPTGVTQIDGGQITAVSITGAKMVAGTVTANEIAAGAITTSKMLVTSKGQAINDDPSIEDASAWIIQAGITILNNASSPGTAGANYFLNSSTLDAIVKSTRFHAVDPAKTYSLTANILAATGNNRAMYLLVEFKDINGAHVATSSPSWGATYSGYLYGAVPPGDGILHRVGGPFGAGTVNPIPSNAVSMQIGVWFQYSGSGSSAVVQAAQDIRLERVNDASLIVDGAIIASKLAADSVTAGKIAAAAISAREIQAGAITADRMAVGDFTNLCNNADFELGNIGWGGSGYTIQNAPASAKYGNWVAFFSQSVSSGTLRNTNLVNVTPGDILYARAWTQTFTAGTDAVFIRITGYDKNGNEIAIANSATSTSNPWFLVECTGTIPSNVVKARAELVATTVSGGGVSIDSVGLFRVSGITLIQDGAIITQKIAAGAVTADRIAVANLAAIVAELGNAVISITGSLRSGQTAFDTGTGYHFSMPGGVPKASMGIAGGAGWKWDGTTFTIKDAVTVKTTTFAVNHNASVALTKAHTTTYQDLGLYTASSTGGTGTVTYAFSLDQGSTPGQGMSSYITISGATVQVWGKCNIVANSDIYINITATDASGAAATPWAFNINVDWT